MPSRTLAPSMLRSAVAAALTLLAACASSGTGHGTGWPDGPAATIAVDGAAPHAVTIRYGQNYWCWNGYGNQMPAVQSLVAPLGLNLLRAGGYNNDAEKSTGAYGSDPFGHPQIDAFVAYARAVGAEPVLQVPLISNYYRSSTTTPAASADPALAAAMVTYANVTKRYGVKYWEIGNEPDLYGNVNNGVTDVPGYTVDKFIADFKAFAAAMKAVDPSIQILGPELAWRYYPTQAKNGPNDWLTPFLQQCKGSYDVVAIHRYPFAAAQCTVDGAMGDVTTYADFVRKAEALVAEEAPGTPFAITEANITYDGDPTHSSYPASTPTIYAALWLADNLAASRDLGLWAQHYWSLSEGWTLGFVDATTHRPRPEYHAFQLITAHMGPTALAATAPAGFTAYASRSATGDATVVLALNKHGTNDAATFTFSNVSGGPAAGFTVTLPAYSISVVTFPDGGGAPSVLRYSGAEVARGAGPTAVAP